MNPPVEVRAVERRFLVLRALRWLPTGLLIPVLVLLLLDRGLSLGQIGLVFAAQGLMVMVLELPTGGLADAVGRRPVLLAAGVFEFAAVFLLIGADTLPLLALVAGLQGVYRALESGPLDSWYVDTAQGLDPSADIERGLSRGGVVLGVAIGAGSLASSLLVAVHPLPGVDPLVTPLVAALVLRAVEFGVIAALVTEPGRRRAETLRAAIAGVPAVVADAVGTVRASTALLALVAVDFLWGFGMPAFEVFTPAKLVTVVDGADRAAALLGPASTAAWLMFGIGSAVVPTLVSRRGPGPSAAGLRVLHGLTVLGLALAAGPVGVVVAFVLTMGVHGAANPVHQAMVHRAVTEPDRRATVVSAGSLTAQGGGMLGGIALGALADAAGLTVAIVVGAAILAAPAPLYVLAGRRRGTPDAAGDHRLRDPRE